MAEEPQGYLFHVDAIEPVDGDARHRVVAITVETRNQKNETVLKASAWALLPAGH